MYVACCTREPLCLRPKQLRIAVNDEMNQTVFRLRLGEIMENKKKN